jgi:hypothetical protein
VGGESDVASQPKPWKEEAVSLQRSRFVSLVGAVLATLVLASSVAAGGRPFSGTMTGAEEAPGPGDPDGSGTFQFTFNQGQREVCFDLFVEDILLPASAAHIHIAPVGSPGPVVIGLTAPDASGVSSGCVEDVDPNLIKAIRQNPSAYYVNVHNSEFPGGAVRGQLSK